MTFFYSRHCGGQAVTAAGTTDMQVHLSSRRTPALETSASDVVVVDEIDALIKSLTAIYQEKWQAWLSMLRLCYPEYQSLPWLFLLSPVSKLLSMPA